MKRLVLAALLLFGGQVKAQSGASGIERAKWPLANSWLGIRDPNSILVMDSIGSIRRSQTNIEIAVLSGTSKDWRWRRVEIDCDQGKMRILAASDKATRKLADWTPGTWFYVESTGREWLLVKMACAKFAHGGVVMRGPTSGVSGADRVARFLDRAATIQFNQYDKSKRFFSLKQLLNTTGLDRPGSVSVVSPWIIPSEGLLLVARDASWPKGMAACSVIGKPSIWAGISGRIQGAPLAAPGIGRFNSASAFPCRTDIGSPGYRWHKPLEMIF